MTEIPQLSKRCQICTSENKYLIQKAIDNGASVSQIAKEYNVSASSINYHIKAEHRENLLAFGVMDYIIKRKAIDVGLTLADYLEKWKSVISERPGQSIKDSDALKALELYSKVTGNLINKHEVTVKRSVEDALKEFLECDEDETEHTEEKEGKDDEIKILETAKS